MTKQFTYYLVVFFLLLESNIAFGQNKKNEPYQQKNSFSKISKSSYRSPNEATKKLKAAEKLFKSEPEKALDLVHDALLIAIKENYLKDEADAYNLLGEFNYKLNEYNLSYKNYGKAIAIYNKQGFSTIFEIYYNIGKSAEKLSDYKMDSRTKSYMYDEVDLESKTTKNVDETLDRIREANVEKGRSMREILADIWNMNEGKNVFAPEKKEKMSFEGFASDAQRKAAFASGYKEKGKKESKTATGEKPTKVELDPKVK